MCDQRLMAGGGRGNAVFHFMAADPSTGLVLVSTPEAQHTHDDSLQQIVAAKFRKYASGARLCVCVCVYVCVCVCVCVCVLEGSK